MVSQKMRRPWSLDYDPGMLNWLFNLRFINGVKKKVIDTFSKFGSDQLVACIDSHCQRLFVGITTYELTV